jgi:hypothetical protein
MRRLKGRRVTLGKNVIVTLKVQNGKYASILLNHKGGRAWSIINAEDIDLVKDYRWYMASGYALTNIYNPSTKKRSILQLHRLLLNPESDQECDHKNRKRLYNYRKNLRACTRIQNIMNSGPEKSNISGYKGVGWQESTKKWTAQLWVKGKRIYLGIFTASETAALAYNKAALKYHDEFAYQNKI